MTTPFDDYLLYIPEENRLLISQLHELILAADKKIGYALKWSTPWYALSGKDFVYLKSNKGYVNLGFPKGADLVIRGHQLEGSGKGMRHIKIRPDADIRKLPVKKLLAAALELEKNAHR